MLETKSRPKSKFAQSISSRKREIEATLRLAMARDEQQLREMGARIKELRLAHGYKQQWIADQIGVTLRTYQNWQAGATPPEQENLEKLAELFEVEPRYIMRGDTPDLLGTMGGDALARLERIETAIEDLATGSRLDRLERIEAALETLARRQELYVLAMTDISTRLEQIQQTTEQMAQDAIAAIVHTKPDSSPASTTIDEDRRSTAA